MSTLVLDGQRPFPRRLLGLGYRFQFVEAEEALRDVLSNVKTGDRSRIGKRSINKQHWGLLRRVFTRLCHQIS
jgi:hypothetical protein